MGFIDRLNEDNEIVLYFTDTIDDAYHKLMEARKYGKFAFCRYNDVIMESDKINTLDDAYITVEGCTKEEYEMKNRKGELLC